jgi:tellurite resistance-related uncharacterized protein
VEDLTMPDGLTHTRTTAEWDAESTPAAIRSAHVVAEGVWGRLCVRAGSVTFVFEDDDSAPRVVQAGEHQVIPPARPHHVEPAADARFVVEFYAPKG